MASSIDYSPLADESTSVSAARANLLAMASLPLYSVVVIPFALRWGWMPWLSAADEALWSIWFIPIFLALICAHEGLHGIGFHIFGSAPRDSICFGFRWQALAPFAHCGSPMSARAYRCALGLPAVVLGLLPSIIAIVIGSSSLAVWGWLMTVSAAGDFVALWAMRHASPHALVCDHPDRVGCRVIIAAEREPAS